jgi:hypothetical protein
LGGFRKIAAPMTNDFADLRANYFTLPRVGGGIPEPLNPNEPWGVIMEIGYPQATVTTVAFSDGTASVLRSSGGGFFGGGDDRVQGAAREFLKYARLVQPLMTRTGEFPGPDPGQIVFYARADTGVYAISAPEAEVSVPGSPMFPIYFAGLGVLHEYLRLQQRTRQQ